jgi:hypothetical protein
MLAYVNLPVEGNRGGSHMRGILLRWLVSIKAVCNSLLIHFAGLLQAYNYTPKDAFWGQLGGSLDAIDAGTTFVLHHGHGVYTVEHGESIQILFLSPQGLHNLQ